MPTGVFGDSHDVIGVHGRTAATGFAGIYGFQGTPSGTLSAGSGGVVGDSHDGIGVSGLSASGAGVSA